MGVYAIHDKVGRILRQVNVADPEDQITDPDNEFVFELEGYVNDATVRVLDGELVLWDLPEQNIQAVKDQALRDLDRLAEDLRAQYITAGATKQAVYAAKLVEAEKILSTDAPPLGELPYLLGEAADDGMSLFEKAVQVVSQREEWVRASAAIERVTAKAKKDIREAKTSLQVDDLMASLDWGLTVKFQSG